MLRLAPSNWWKPPADPDWNRASSIDKFLRCERKWAWAEFGPLTEGESTEAQRLGTEVHAELERYLKGGRLNLMTEAGQIALSGIDLLPPPEHRVSIETPFVIRIEGHLFHGTPDLVTFDPVTRTLTIWDHKTTKSFGWSKSAHELLSNVQACLYAYVAMILAGVTSVRLVWLYYRTKKPYRALRPPTEITVTESEIAPTIRRMLDAAERIRIIRQSGIKDALALAPNASECEAYGGCPYRDRCNLSPGERLQGIMTQQSEIMARMNAELARQQGLTAPAQTAQTAQPEQPVAPGLPAPQPGFQWMQTPQGFVQVPAVVAPIQPAAQPLIAPGQINPPPPAAPPANPFSGIMPSGTPVTAPTPPVVPPTPAKGPGRPRKAAPGARDTFLAGCGALWDLLAGSGEV